MKKNISTNSRQSHIRAGKEALPLVAVISLITVIFIAAFIAV